MKPDFSYFRAANTALNLWYAGRKAENVSLLTYPYTYVGYTAPAGVMETHVSLKANSLGNGNYKITEIIRFYAHGQPSWVMTEPQFHKSRSVREEISRSGVLTLDKTSEYLERYEAVLDQQVGKKNEKVRGTPVLLKGSMPATHYSQLVPVLQQRPTMRGFIAQFMAARAA
jgi:hypothetical protein